MFYGAAEFSRDLDLLVLVESDNIERMLGALKDLNAEPIAVPTFDVEFLRRGHAVHFRCRREDVAGLRIDLMSSLRGVASFTELWERRTSIEVADEVIDLLSLEDLVKAKKTQRDKDWPIIRRLVEQSYFAGSGRRTPQQIEFWLRELRTPELLMEVATTHPALAASIGLVRPSVRAAILRDLPEITRLLFDEENEERKKDHSYWEPLKRELEEFRRRKRESREPRP